MGICHVCGGIIGRDCFNPQECEQITRSMAAEYKSQPDYESKINELIEENKSLKSACKELIDAIEQYNNLDRKIDNLEKETESLKAINKELIEALEEMVARFYFWGNGNETDRQKAVSKAQSAITKAKSL